MRRALLTGLVLAAVCAAVLGGASSAHASATVDPVEDPTYWPQIWDHVGALDTSSSAFNPTADWVSSESGWAADGYVASASEAAAAKAAIDASAADTSAMEAAGSIPFADEAAAMTILAPEVALPAALVVGGTLLVGTGTGQRLIHLVTDGLFGGGSGSGGGGTSFQVTGRINYEYYGSTSGIDGVTYGAGFIAGVGYLNEGTGATGWLTTMPDCSQTGANCSLYEWDKYNELQAASGTLLRGSPGCSGHSCSVEKWESVSAVKTGVQSITQPGATPTWTTTAGGAQADPGSGSQKAANVRAAIESNPTLHQQYDCKLDPADYVCPAMPTTPGTNPGTGGGTTSPAWAPFYLPTVLPGETVQSYLDRLAARTWVGTATVVDDAMGYPAGSAAMQAAPRTITSVSVGTSSPVLVPVFDPATGQTTPWPVSPPQVSTSTTPITITEVPPTWVPSPPPGGGITVPTVNSPCDKFPFGVFCWIKSNLQTLFTSPVVCPNISMTIPSEHVNLWATDYTIGSYSFGWDFCSTQGQVFNDYLSTVRTVLAYLLWLGGLFYLGSRLLSIRGAPDTSGAGTEVGGEESF